MTSFTAVVPVKRWVDAKTRLDLESSIRSDLARAFAEDVVAALAQTRSVGRVVVVSSETEVVELARRWSVHLVTDPVDAVGDRLNASVAAGVGWASRCHPDDAVVVVPADLPSLTGGAVDRALALAGSDDRAMLSDSSGHGTTLLIGASPELVVPRYGPASAAVHAAHGHREIRAAEACLRRDVDSVADLAEAVRLGVGSATQAVLRRHPLDLAG